MPRSKFDDPCFLMIECPDCENEQISYSHASTKVECRICGKTLLEPRGGKAEIKGKILGVVG